jgi:uncharacterized protein YndB with AHSA1/START domain
MITQTAIKTEVLSDDSVRLTCSLPALPAKVYEAWTRPEALVRWFAPEPGAICRVPRFDLRIGGEFEIDLEMQGALHSVIGEFEILEQDRIIGFTWACDDCATGSDNRTPSHVIVELFAEGSGTRLQLTDTRLVSAEQAASHTRGWTGCLTSLSQHFASSR